MTQIHADPRPLYQQLGIVTGEIVRWQGFEVEVVQVSRFYDTRIRVAMPDGEQVWVRADNVERLNDGH